ncbi:MAG: hypothetical protein FWE68_06450, partial [Defluviitaleaceae bacterium]|nr:hypothetical protein [Defluviitaleaceae bacterium]
GVVGFFLLVRVARPLTRFIKNIIIVMIFAFIALFLMSGLQFTNLFGFINILDRKAFFYLPLFYFSFHIHGFLGRCCRSILDKLAARRRERERANR